VLKGNEPPGQGLASLGFSRMRALASRREHDTKPSVWTAALSALAWTSASRMSTVERSVSIETKGGSPSEGFFFSEREDNGDPRLFF
jgi:hypothetical protein